MIVATGSFGGLRSLVVAIESVQGNELHPSSLLQFDPKNPFQKTPLLKGNLWTVLSYERRRSKHYVKLAMIKKN